MAILVLLSTVSWTIEKHTCMGRVMDVAFFTKADDCGMAAAVMAMGDDTVENHCCGDEVVTLQGQDDLQQSLKDYSLGQQFFLVAFTTSYLQVFLPAERQTNLNEYYPPPPLIKDIQLLDETFLI